MLDNIRLFFLEAPIFCHRLDCPYLPFQYKIKHSHLSIRIEHHMSHKAVSLLLITFFSVTLIAKTALAARYDCKTEQAFEWKNGKINEVKNDAHSAVRLKDIVRFDDKTGFLWAGPDPNAPIKLHLDQALQADNSLVASLGNVEGRYVGTLILRIQHVKDKLKFLFISDENFEAGHCSIMNE
jgi:hypothetical protein